MNKPLEAGLVDVPCKVVVRSAVSITIAAGGRRHVIARRHVMDERDGCITVPSWFAADQQLLTSAACLVVADIAERFGNVNADWVYRNIQRLMEKEGFPRPVSELGRPRWDPSSVEAWFTRHHPDRIGAAVGRARALPRMAQPYDGEGDEAAVNAETRAALAEHYGTPGMVGRTA